MSASPDASLEHAVRLHYARAISDGAPARHASHAQGANASASLRDGGTLAALAGGPMPPSFGCGDPFRHAALRPGDVVLDLGCGAGLDVLLAARQVGSHGRVYGLDLTDEMLAEAQANADLAGVEHVVFLRGDIQSIPLPARSVDVIVSNCVLNLATDKGAAFREAARVLRPGGRLAVSDVVVDGDLTTFALSEREVRSALGWEGCLGGALPIAALRDGLATSGFDTIAIVPTTRYTAQRVRRRLTGALAQLPVPELDRMMACFCAASISAVRAAA